MPVNAVTVVMMPYVIFLVGPVLAFQRSCHDSMAKQRAASELTAAF